MLGSLFLFLLSLPQGGKGGEMGENAVSCLIKHSSHFFQST